MTPLGRDEARDERITHGVIVDAYMSEEQALGWCCSLGWNMNYLSRRGAPRNGPSPPWKKARRYARSR